MLSLLIHFTAIPNHHLLSFFISPLKYNSSFLPSNTILHLPPQKKTHAHTQSNPFLTNTPFLNIKNILHILFNIHRSHRIHRSTIRSYASLHSLSLTLRTPHTSLKLLQILLERLTLQLLLQLQSLRNIPHFLPQLLFLIRNLILLVKLAATRLIQPHLRDSFVVLHDHHRIVLLLSPFSHLFLLYTSVWFGNNALRTHRELPQCGLRRAMCGTKSPRFRRPRRPERGPFVPAATRIWWWRTFPW